MALNSLRIKSFVFSCKTYKVTKSCSDSFFQKQAMLVRQLEEEVVKTRQHAKETNPEIKAHIESLQLENDHLTREVAILKETIKVSWLVYNTVTTKALENCKCNLIKRVQEKSLNSWILSQPSKFLRPLWIRNTV